MAPRFSVSVIALAVVLAVVMLVAVIGFFGAVAHDDNPDLLAPVTASALGELGKLVFAVLLASAVAGVLGWLALFGLRRDGSHRLEWVAFLPANYGGRSPFDTSDRR